VDDFGVQYTGREHAEHLHATLQTHYDVTTDWEGVKFAGIDLQWDYTKRTCRATMDGYIEEVLLNFDHPRPKKPQHAPHKHRKIIYGADAQLQTVEVDTSPPLDATGVKRVQAIVGCLLYYARACDNKLLCTLSTISAQQASATQNTMVAVNNLLDHVATYPSDGITFKASNMILEHTPMPATSARQNHAAERVRISSSPTATPYQITMARYYQFRPSSDQSTVQLQKRN